MLEELKRFLVFMKPAFSRRATYCWFVVVFVGFILRTDNFGVSSIVRSLLLPAESYTCLLHFFHSSAWNVETIMAIWWQWLVKRNVAHRIGNRLVLVGDHTKTPKDGRKIPVVPPKNPIQWLSWHKNLCSLRIVIKIKGTGRFNKTFPV